MLFVWGKNRVRYICGGCGGDIFRLKLKKVKRQPLSRQPTGTRLQLLTR